MESWTMTKPAPSLRSGQALSGAKGDDDGGRADGRGSHRPIGFQNGQSEEGSVMEASLFDEPNSRAGPKKSAKRGKFGGNKATMWLRMSNLIQKGRKNKANSGCFRP